MSPATKSRNVSVGQFSGLEPPGHIGVTGTA